MDDPISRQVAIDALKKDKASLDHIIRGMSANDVRLDAYVSQRNQVNYDIDTINNLPTAQPEQLGTNLAEGGTDCISRQAAIDALRAMQTYKLFAGDDMLLIDQAGAQTELMLLPPAPQWHLMTEKPEIENDYLVTIRGAFGRNWIEMASYNGDERWIVWSKELDVTDCIAWAELPEPYKGETDE